MYHPTTRLLTILELLQTFSSLTSAQLSRRLEVEPRSVRRYILMLQELGLPVEAVHGPGGGYRLRPGFKLPPLMFTEEEAGALVLGLLGTPWLEVGQAPVAVEGALAKLLRVLPPASRRRLEAVWAHLSLAVDEADHGPPIALFLDLSQAVEQRQALEIEYRNLDDQASTRVVEPYGVVGWWGRWYLIAWCRLRQGYRTFRLGRIRSARLLVETFTRAKGFDPESFVRAQMDREDRTWTIRVDFADSLATVRRRFPDWFGPLSATPTGTRFETTRGDPTVVARLLAESGLEFSVQEPPKLRALLLEMAARLQRGAGPHAGQTGLK